MKASELRIGNYVSLHGILVEMTASDFNFDESYFTPIPITEEWLLKFGFIQIHENNWQDVECEIMVDLFNEKIYIISAMPWKQLNHIKYVHQLQNLYFALTNEELTYEQQK